MALEREYNDDLTGKTDEFESLLDEVRGREREGNDVFTNLDPQAQQVARDGLAGRAGSVVALDPRTGRVRVVVSIPGYDPNEIPDQFGDLRKAPGSPLLDRAVQSGYPPGSTFKVVTATAAIDSGEYNPNSVVDGKSPKRIGGVPLANFGEQGLRPDHAHDRAHQLGQHGVGRGRSEGREADVVRVHAALRVRAQAAARPALRRDAGERRVRS